MMKNSRQYYRKSNRIKRAYLLVIFLGILIPVSVLFLTSEKGPFSHEEETFTRASLKPSDTRDEASENDGTTDADPSEYTSSNDRETESVPANIETETDNSTSQMVSDETDPTKETEETEEETTLSEEDLKREEALSVYRNLGIVVNAPKYLNMRNIPSLDGEVCGVIFPYCGVDILEHTDNGWYKIISGGTTGYVSDKYIETGEEAIKLGREHCRFIAVPKEDGVKMYSKADDDSDLIMFINIGDDFDCVKEGKKWVKVELYEGFYGYLKKEEVTTGYRLDDAIAFADANGASQLRRDIINTAFQYYGGKYVFNGTSLTDGIDCSAFTQAIFGKNGIRLERNSWLQAGQGKHIEESEYRPGDLLFYFGAHTGGIGHVGIYIGNGKIIHAASERMGICVSNFKRVPILEARNVIGD